jgi:hypothetical protein
MVWIQKDTERHYSQREDGKNVLVVDDRATEVMVLGFDDTLDDKR